MCKDDIISMCSFEPLEDIETFDLNVINCLQDYKSEIRTPQCKERVKHYVALSASNIKFNHPLAEACSEDRKQFCAGVPPVS